MTLSWLDISILVVYFVGVMGLGLYVRKFASKDITAFFLAGKQLPAWMLGISGMATNFDMTGTMLMASFCLMVGVKCLLVGLRGEVMTMLSFLMVIGVWLRRANVMTNAEYMEFRFGSGTDGHLARIVNAVATILIFTTLIAYLTVGGVKFLTYFFPAIPGNVSAILLVVVTMIYAAASGMFGVAFVDVFQSLLIAAGVFSIAIMAFVKMDLETIRNLAPAGWTDITPTWTYNFPPGYEGYNMFGFALMAWIVKEVFSGFSAGGMAADVHQRYYAAKTPRDCGKLALTWIVTFAFRWPLIIGVAALALPYAAELADPEMALPVVLNKYFPSGLKGLQIAALFAAAMSTFAAIIDVGANYFVRDIYERYLVIGKAPKHYVLVGKLSSIVVVIVSLSIAYSTGSINAIWSWLVMSLGAPMSLPMLLRYYWWRFNGWGYACSAVAGMITAIIQRIFFPGLPEYLDFFTVIGVAFIGAMAGTFLTKPNPQEKLLEFYRQVRPMGVWGPIARLLPESERMDIRREHRDMLKAIAVCVPWHYLTFLTPMYIVIHYWSAFGISAVLWVVFSLGVYFVWWKGLMQKIA